LFGDLFSLSAESAGGISFKMSAASALKYNHTTGAGANYVDVTDGVLDEYYYACGERASVFIVVSTDSTYTGTTSTVVSLSLDLNVANPCCC